MPADTASALPARACALCGGAAPQVHFAQVPDYLTGEAFAVRRCGGCGMASTDPQPASMNQYYPAAYRRYGALTVRVLRLLYGWKIRGWAERLRRGGRVFEIGCGDGWMLGALRGRGWRVIGSERSIDACRSAAITNGVPVFVGELDALLASRHFDAVVLFQVLEHLAEPLDTLRRAADLLAPGGLMVVAVPNFASWQAVLFGASWFHLDVPRHRHHFTPDSLARSFEQVGLRVVRTRFVSFEHDPYGWVQSALNSLGFEQNALTKYLMGTARKRTNTATLAAMLALTGVLIVPSVALAVLSWAARAGAIMEVWAAKA
jgi:2-polyprenyl-3-methyl-5-hydroxy-6-metoxy-1,4-benzoquinol methylase